MGAACSLVVSLLAFASEDSVREPLSVVELLWEDEVLSLEEALLSVL